MVAKCEAMHHQRNKSDVKLENKKGFSIVDDISFFENTAFTFRKARCDSFLIWMSNDNNKERKTVPSNGC